MHARVPPVGSVLVLIVFLAGCSEGTVPPDGGVDAGTDAEEDAAGGDPGDAPASDPGADAAGDNADGPASDPGDGQGSDPGGDDGPLFTAEPIEDFDDPLLRVSIRFSPVDETETIVLSEIARAEQSVHLAFFNIRLQAVADTLVALDAAGVEVRILMDQKQMDQVYNTLDDWMIAQGLDVIGVLNDNTADSTMHNKFTIIDGRRVLTGSLNYTTTAFNQSDEDLFLLDDEEIAGLYEEEFQELLAGTEVERDPDTDPIEVWFSPEDRVDNMVVDALQSARTSIHLMMFDATLASLQDALVDALGRGVNVVFLMDGAQADDTDFDEVIEQAGAHVLRAPRTFPVELHDKLCAVDGNLVLGGSYNWTASASFYNDENYLRIESAPLATRLDGRVAALVAQEAVPFDPAAFGWSGGNRQVRFHVTNLQVRADAACYIVGDHPALGSMDVSQAVELSPEPHPLGLVWVAEVQLPAGENVAYRFLIRGPDGIPHLEGDSPRSVRVPFTPGPHAIYDTFRP